MSYADSCHLYSAGKDEGTQAGGGAGERQRRVLRGPRKRPERDAVGSGTGTREGWRAAREPRTAEHGVVLPTENWGRHPPDLSPGVHAGRQRERSRSTV